jgi:hypothetical protein
MYRLTIHPSILICTRRAFLWGGALFLLLALVTPMLSSAQTETSFVVGYEADQPLEKGRIVALVKDNPQKVEPVPYDQPDRIHGVVVDANDAPVTLTSEGQKVFVATGGRHDVLVSAENGIINVGDYLSMSNADGIAAKATDKQEYILGKALSNFDGHTGIITTGDNKAGIARVVADISVSRNPIKRIDVNFLPKFLQKTAEGIAGKPVNMTRVYVSLGILIITGLIAGSLLYGGVRSSIISIGRNPLSKKSIIRGLFQVVIVSLIIFLTGIFAVYLLLKL